MAEAEVATLRLQ